MTLLRQHINQHFSVGIKDRDTDGEGLSHPQTRLTEPPSGQWNEEDYDVLANGEVVGRVFKVNAAPVGSPWMWTLAFGYHRDRAANHGYAATREAAMAAFAKSWRRE
jgi:hypothetical protein